MAVSWAALSPADEHAGQGPDAVKPVPAKRPQTASMLDDPSLTLALLYVEIAAFVVVHPPGTFTQESARAIAAASALFCSCRRSYMMVPTSTVRAEAPSSTPPPSSTATMAAAPPRSKRRLRRS